MEKKNKIIIPGKHFSYTYGSAELLGSYTNEGGLRLTVRTNIYDFSTKKPQNTQSIYVDKASVLALQLWISRTYSNRVYNLYRRLLARLSMFVRRFYNRTTPRFPR